jgi:hypothetical protein
MAEDTPAQYCQILTASQQLQANVMALHRNKSMFFSQCWREVWHPYPRQPSFSLPSEEVHAVKLSSEVITIAAGSH